MVVMAAAELESTMSGAEPVTDTDPPPVSVRDPGAVGLSTRMPTLGATHTPWATARAEIVTLSLPKILLK